MRAPFFHAGLAALFVLGFAPVPVGSQAFGIDFEFNVLKFTFLPEGFEGSGDEGGSALEAYADRVQIKDADALDLRHCIDGQRDCSYYDALQVAGYRGNQNRVVEQNELNNFQILAPLGVKQEPKIVALNNLLQHNLTVDGLEGKRPRVDNVTFAGALGDIESQATVDAFITIEVEYDNDKKAKTHEVVVRDLSLTSQGFAYGNAVWIHKSSRSWSWSTDATQPPAAKTFVTKEGWFSTQPQFEDSTKGPLKLVIEQKGSAISAGGMGLWIALGLFILLALAVLAFLLLRRR